MRNHVPILMFASVVAAQAAGAQVVGGV